MISNQLKQNNALLNKTPFLALSLASRTFETWQHNESYASHEKMTSFRKGTKLFDER